MNIEEYRKGLLAARATAAVRRTAVENAAVALAQAHKAEDDAIQKVQACELDVEAAQERPAYEAAVAARESAKVDHVMAVRQTNAREDDSARALRELRAAHTHVEKAVDALLDAEKPARNAEFERLVAALVPLAETIAGYTPDPINRVPGYSTGLSPTAERVLEAFLQETDSLNTPVNMLNAGPHSRYRAMREQRRARLIAGAVEGRS